MANIDPRPADLCAAPPALQIASASMIPYREDQLIGSPGRILLAQGSIVARRRQSRGRIMESLWIRDTKLGEYGTIAMLRTWVCAGL